MTDQNPPQPTNPLPSDRATPAHGAAAPPVTPGQLPPEVMAALQRTLSARSPILGPLQIPLMLGAQQTQLWQGQYPPPEAVERYERVLPGTFNRMVSMAEQLQAAQIEASLRNNDFIQRDTRRGHWLGFGLGVLGMAGSLTALIVGHSVVAACAFLALPVMGVAKVLIDSAKGNSAATVSSPPNDAG